MSYLKKTKPYLYSRVIFGSLLGLLLFSCSETSESSKENDPQQRLKEVNQEAVAKIEKSIDQFAAVIFDFRTYTSNCASLEDGWAAQAKINELLAVHEVNDSIVVSYVDSSHTFIYSFTQTKQDPAGLVGTIVTSIRDRGEIDHLNEIMNDDELHFFEPINLVEGYPGIPLNFGVRRGGERKGYVASIINIRSILASIYADEDMISEFVFMFRIKDGPEFDREKVYDETPVYHQRIDPEHHSNFDIPEDDFYFSDLSRYGLTIEVGTAYKSK